MLMPLFFFGTGGVIVVLLVYISVIYVPVYGTVATLYSIKSLLGLIVLTNFIPLVIFGAYCFRKGCMDLFAEWNGKYLGMVGLWVIFSFWAFILWLFVREKKAT